MRTKTTGVEIPSPSTWRISYGDTYMQLPPVEKRKTHFPYILDFGDGERYENVE